jgi:hypothetical protein
MSRVLLRGLRIVKPEHAAIATGEADCREASADARYEPTEAEIAADRKTAAEIGRQFASWG